MARLQPGDKAPGFRLKDQSGKTVKLSDFKGKKLLVYLYPKASTPGCTTQSCSVRDHRSALSRRGVKVVGISPDLPAAQERFDDRHGLGFPLLPDSDHAVAEAYGAWGPKTFMGRKYDGIIRSSFLIGPTGKVVEAWYKISPKDTVPRLLAAL